jgi:S1-C subfamily serine protease
VHVGEVRLVIQSASWRAFFLVAFGSLVILTAHAQSDHSIQTVKKKTAHTNPSQTETSPAKLSSPREIADRTFPSVVLVVVNDSNGEPLAFGSGFYVRSNVIATNLHVIDGAAGGYVKIVGQTEKHVIKGTVAVDSQHDLVLLDTGETAAAPLLLGDSSQIGVGDEIFAVGNPRGLEGTFSEGIVSSIRQMETSTLLQITTPISPGSSGGPILNVAGKCRRSSESVFF